MTTWPFSQVPVEFENEHIKTIQHAGWHFSFLGNNDKAKQKLERFAHSETRYLSNSDNIQKMLEKNIGFDENTKFEKVIIDEYFPKTIRKNLDRWNSLIVPNATASIQNFLPMR
jgi:hypothetical protein